MDVLWDFSLIGKGFDEESLFSIGAAIENAANFQSI